MNTIKKILFTIIIFITNKNLLFAEWIKDWLLGGPDENTLIIKDTKDWLSILDSIFNYIQNSISWLILLIALWVFIYIWINLVIARWNPEDFKKHMMQFVYAAIWFFVVSISWAVVKLVAWLNI